MRSQIYNLLFSNQSFLSFQHGNIENLRASLQIIGRSERNPYFFCSWQKNPCSQSCWRRSICRVFHKPKDRSPWSSQKNAHNYTKQADWGTSGGREALYKHKTAPLCKAWIKAIRTLENHLNRFPSTNNSALQKALHNFGETQTESLRGGRRKKGSKIPVQMTARARRRFKIRGSRVAPGEFKWIQLGEA